MNGWIAAWLVLWLGTASASAVDWLGVWSPALRRGEARHALLREEMSRLGKPMVGNTVAEFGVQHVMVKVPPPMPPYLQVDLGESVSMDTVVLVPAVVDFREGTLAAYAFPARFRVDASDSPSFDKFVPLFVQTESDFMQDGVEPVVIAAGAVKARYLRLTVTKLAFVDGYWTYALSELLVLQGNRNLAMGAPVKQTGGINILPRWASRNLTDGRSPLGPPLRAGSALPTYDALFVTVPSGGPAWTCVDLGAEVEIEEVRLHPLHARQGADVPGFRFPLQFRVDVARSESMEDPTVIWDAGGVDFPNPGNNPVTIRASGVRGRFVRLVMLKPDLATARDFALSEMQVYAGGRNVAFGARVSSSGDPGRSRPLQDLTDGKASYGDLLELPSWLQEWERRRELRRAMRDLEGELEGWRRVSRLRAIWAGSGLGAVVVGIGVGMGVASRRRQRRELEEFRTKLARDMHDEVGSNLAGIAVLSELGARSDSEGREDWRDVNRIARETTDAMREVLWLVGARQESGIALVPQMRRVAERLLNRHEVVWCEAEEGLFSEWSAEEGRQVFLFFKEAVTNIVRHAAATRVELAIGRVDEGWELSLRDDGRGFDRRTQPEGVGLASMRARAQTLGGRCEIETAPGRGTRIRLFVRTKGRARKS
ncbi:MAG: hypothetical protein RLZZ244_2791 [Verrucomicrobiota bacterium]